jgi:hypothetical protein
MILSAVVVVCAVSENIIAIVKIKNANIPASQAMIVKASSII